LLRKKDFPFPKYQKKFWREKNQLSEKGRSNPNYSARSTQVKQEQERLTEDGLDVILVQRVRLPHPTARLVDCGMFIFLSSFCRLHIPKGGKARFVANED
jgi:hypothetical protein